MAEKPQKPEGDEMRSQVDDALIREELRRARRFAELSMEVQRSTGWFESLTEEEREFVRQIQREKLEGISLSLQRSEELGALVHNKLMDEINLRREGLAAVKAKGETEEMNSSSSKAKVAKMEVLLRRIYELVEYARSKRDSAPIALGHYPGHVEEDHSFRSQVQQLKNDIKSLLDEEWDSLEYPRFISKLERTTPTVPPGQWPGWNRMARCRCWWDAKDELQAIADYLEALRADQKKLSIEDTSIDANATQLSADTGIDTAAVRDLLVAAFDDADLMALCFDRYFLVYNERFGEGMSKGEKIQSLLDYCARRGLLKALIELVKERNLYQYNIYTNRIFMA